MFLSFVFYIVGRAWRALVGGKIEEQTTSAAPREWEFDSLIKIPYGFKSKILQVWSRPALGRTKTREWTLTKEVDGTKNPPKNGCGYYTNTEYFKWQYPNFGKTISLRAKECAK